MAAVHFTTIPWEPKTARKVQGKPYFCSVCPCAIDIVYTGSEGFISNISNTRDSLSSGYPNTEKRVENTTRSGVFLTKLEVFGQPMKRCLECLYISKMKTEK